MATTTLLERLALARAARSAKAAERQQHGGVALRECPKCQRAVGDSYMRRNRCCPYCHRDIVHPGKARVLKFNDGSRPVDSNLP